MVVAALWGTSASASSPHPAVHRGAVLGSGFPTMAPDGWRVEHPSTGVYRITVDDPDVTLDVRNWDAVADVTVRPLGDGANEVRFDVGGTPVDSAFGFVTLAHR
jgi:hypothetical protein